MTIEDILKDIHLEATGDYLDENEYEIEITDSDVFGKAYSYLDNDVNYRELTQNSVVTEDTVYCIFKRENFRISLIGDLKNDRYRIIINEV